ncbi:MBL fold metallo-hydrolase [Alicyclobacillus tolerans]|uniref:Glyoxylase, beta-lactamase superfamily II n=1 Tax=Alicyclobacillus tolerans TaxID=90970 RepID=A0A1M6Y9V9_9BACL|nr:MBL fold metallo-hydrolase [Alicyclobacillus montanus]SHL15041.1 Glyoxylase, beta-lactamase superfamily II [Alicyclobacillus montanus]
MVKRITVEELKKRMDSKQGVVILDVRPSNAYQEWRIQGDKVRSLNIQNSKLKEFGVESFSDIPKQQEVVTVCARGISAQEAAEWLEEKGYQASYLDGGMSAWSEFYEPVTVIKNEKYAIYQIMRLAKGCLSYVITSGQQAIIVDAGRNVERYEDFAKQLGVKITDVIDTHLHADHISGGNELAKRTGAKYWISPEETVGATFNFVPLKDGQTLTLGEAKIKVFGLHTPGHTIGSMSLLVDDKYLLSGDTLFISGLGRSDLKGHVQEMAHKMFETVTTKIAAIPDDVIVLPGHYSDFQEINTAGYVGESMSTVRKNNPMLHMTNETEFVKIAVGNVGVTPPNHETIIAINRGQLHPSKEEQAELEVGPNRCAVKH